VTFAVGGKRNQTPSSVVTDAAGQVGPIFAGSSRRDRSPSGYGDEPDHRVCQTAAASTITAMSPGPRRRLQPARCARVCQDGICLVAGDPARSTPAVPREHR
jgi:hypothetical protein